MLRKESTSIQNVAYPAGAEATLERLFPQMEESSTLVVTCRRGDYSASRIARAVEDADAHLLNLNVTSDSERSDNRITAELRISHRDPEAAARIRHTLDSDPLRPNARFVDMALSRSGLTVTRS